MHDQGTIEMVVSRHPGTLYWVVKLVNLASFTSLDGREYHVGSVLTLREVQVVVASRRYHVEITLGD